MSGGHSYGKVLGVLASRSLFLVLPLLSSCHPLTTHPCLWFPIQRLMPIPAEFASSPLQVQFCFAARLVNESMGSGAMACHLLEVGFSFLSLRVLIFVVGTLPEPASLGVGHDDVKCLAHSGHLTNSGRGSCQALFPTCPAYPQTHWERPDPFI